MHDVGLNTPLGLGQSTWLMLLLFKRRILGMELKEYLGELPYFTVAGFE
jgi:hypothetical protein